MKIEKLSKEIELKEREGEADKFNKDEKVK